MYYISPCKIEDVNFSSPLQFPSRGRLVDGAPLDRCLRRSKICKCFSERMLTMLFLKIKPLECKLSIGMQKNQFYCFGIFKRKGVRFNVHPHIVHKVDQENKEYQLRNQSCWSNSFRSTGVRFNVCSRIEFYREEPNEDNEEFLPTPHCLC